MLNYEDFKTWLDEAAMPSDEEIRAGKFKRVADQRARNKSARKLGYRNHADYVNDEPEQRTNHKGPVRH